MLEETNKIKKILLSSKVNHNELVNVLNKLAEMDIDRKILSKTKLGGIVNKFTRFENQEIKNLAQNLIKVWKSSLSNVSESDKISKFGDRKCSVEFPGPKLLEPYRNKVRSLLFQALTTCFIKPCDYTHAGEIICKTNIETALYEHYVSKSNNLKLYHLQARSIRSNLLDIKNYDFKYDIYFERIKVSDLVTMSSIDMASENKKQERQRMKRNALEACQSDWDLRNYKKVSGQFPCGKCKSQNTTYFQLQTRSSDEPMTTFVTCIECNNRWKF